MKTPCPRCGRSTVIEEEIGDFPTRCTRCGVLVRRRREEPAPAEVTDSAHVPPVIPPVTPLRIQRGMLAGLLTRVPEPTPSFPAIIHAHAGAVVQRQTAHEASPLRPPTHGVLRPESRREILRVRARQQALLKAELKSSQQALGALTWTGLAFIIFLGIGALALKAQALWRHPAPARSDVLRVGE